MKGDAEKLTANPARSKMDQLSDDCRLSRPQYGNGTRDESDVSEICILSWCVTFVGLPSNRTIGVLKRIVRRNISTRKIELKINIANWSATSCECDRQRK